MASPTRNPKLGPGDTAYLMAWCAWRSAVEADSWVSEHAAAQEFTRWWTETGSVLLEEYGYHILDTGPKADEELVRSECGHRQLPPTSIEIEGCPNVIVRNCDECGRELVWKIDQWWEC